MASSLNAALSATRPVPEAAKILAGRHPGRSGRPSVRWLRLSDRMFETLSSLQEADDADDPAERVKMLSAAAKNIAH
jgi:hypothetical protein